MHIIIYIVVAFDCTKHLFSFLACVKMSPICESKKGTPERRLTASELKKKTTSTATSVGALQALR